MGNKTQAWVRLAVTLASFPLIIVLVGGLTLLAMIAWGVVDFYRIAFGNPKDGDGQSLSSDERDKKWTKVIAIVVTIFMVLYVIAAILAVALGAFMGIQERAKSEALSSQSTTQNINSSSPTAEPHIHLP